MEPDPGSRPHPAGTAAQERARPDHDPRLQAQRQVAGELELADQVGLEPVLAPDHKEFLSFLRRLDREYPRGPRPAPGTSERTDPKALPADHELGEHVDDPGLHDPSDRRSHPAAPPEFEARNYNLAAREQWQVLTEMR